MMKILQFATRFCPKRTNCCNGEDSDDGDDGSGDDGDDDYYYYDDNKYHYCTGLCGCVSQCETCSLLTSPHRG